MWRIRIASLTTILAVTCVSTAPSVSSSAATSTPGTATASAILTPTPSPTPAKTGKVTMGDNYFAPDEITIAVGGTVSWEIVAGDAKHDVVAVDGSFHSSSPMNRGDIFSVTLAKPGEYPYICSFHTVEHMMGKVIVK